MNTGNVERIRAQIKLTFDGGDEPELALERLIEEHELGRDADLTSPGDPVSLARELLDDQPDRVDLLGGIDRDAQRKAMHKREAEKQYRRAQGYKSMQVLIIAVEDDVRRRKHEQTPEVA